MWLYTESFFDCDFGLQSMSGACSVLDDPMI